MLNAAIIASVPAAASLANTVLTQVREGSQSFAATLSDTLQSQAAPTAASSPTNFAEAIQDLADSLRPSAAYLSLSNAGLTNADLHNALDPLRDLIRDRLESTGIDDLQDIEFELRTSDGRLTVVGNHPDKARIEAILNNDPNVTNAVTRWASFASTLRLKLDE